MYSLNVPLPSAVTRLAGRLGRQLPGARARPRGEHTLVCKRLGEADYARLDARAREVLSGTPPFEARVDGVGWFPDAARGRSPVVYLTVESPELRRLHERLCGEFDPIDGLEGAEYVPHVTIARGGDRGRARRLTEREIEPVEWPVESLEFYDAERSQRVSRIALPF